MKVIPIPSSLDYQSVDELVRLASGVEEGSVLLDAHRLRWIDPVGMIGLLSLGRVLGERGGTAPVLKLPDGGEVLSYLGRMGFQAAAAGVFREAPAPARRQARGSDVLLELTRIEENRDVHEVVDRVHDRAGKILAHTLRYPPTAVVQFPVILSEVCQNILEHAGAPGWVAAQSYLWKKRLGREVLVIGVGDVGRGFRGSLEGEYSGRYGDRWGDAPALEAAFIHGLTRFPDQGRGHGIQQIRRQVRRWHGAISIRSGTARIADVPDWEEMAPLEDGLAPFPGAQITIILPARTEP